ncbi:hypothetical protein N7541_005354 [Penicillium brevicompactum]|uniref:Uncharacterized protein n=1 Tax=Penicillium brevicompactum TaxID=5074 RepID=A0A9W9UX91_PENBR|nr:hypothetical protein N7541_005354 [Penicillium brevicompactum]
MTTTITTGATPASNIPLTTLFIPPTSCDNLSWVSSDCAGTTCEGIYNIVRATETECYPSGWETSATTFSPGVLCPSGYSFAATTLALFGAASIETRATCCPSGYTVATRNAQEWYEREPCIATSTGVTSITYTIVGTTPTTTTAITYSDPLIHAMPVGIAWQSTDIKSTMTGTSTSTTNPGSEDNTSGLSTGAKAGIGVGVSAGVIALIVALIALVWLRRRGNKVTQDSAPPTHTDDCSTPQKTTTQDHAELDGQLMSAAELPGDRPGSAKLNK